MAIGGVVNKVVLYPVVEQNIDEDRCIKMVDFHPSIISSFHIMSKLKQYFSPITAADINKQISALLPSAN